MVIEARWIAVEIEHTQNENNLEQKRRTRRVNEFDQREGENKWINQIAKKQSMLEKQTRDGGG